SDNGVGHHELLGIRPEVPSKPLTTPATLLPTASFAPGPAATTVPAKSQPRPVHSGWWTNPMPWKTPAGTPRSTGLTGAAATATRTSPGPGSTTGTSMISIESGPSGVRTTAVRKVDVLISHSSVVSSGRNATLDGLLSNGKYVLQSA